MKRNDIKGFTLNLFSFYLEFVFIKYMLRVVAISKPLNKNIMRFEI